jgi:hypothetical protein
MSGRRSTLLLLNISAVIIQTCTGGYFPTEK